MTDLTPRERWLVAMALLRANGDHMEQSTMLEENGLIASSEAVDARAMDEYNLSQRFLDTLAPMEMLRPGIYDLDQDELADWERRTTEKLEGSDA